jgi:hypothetical protein
MEMNGGFSTRLHFNPEFCLPILTLPLAAKDAQELKQQVEEVQISASPE